MLLLVGTIPCNPGHVYSGTVSWTGSHLLVGDDSIAACQGSAAMAFAALEATKVFSAPAPYALFGGDTGGGEGTRAVYRAFEDTLKGLKTTYDERRAQGSLEPFVITFHYLLPVMSLMRHALETIERIVPEALLVADAGGMYAARAAGLSNKFELMTPDVGEIGFLAEKNATHPAYVAEYLFGSEQFDVHELVKKAYALNTASRVLIVKGATDFIAQREAAPSYIIETVSEPNVPELEAIGGTGDTITGLASGLMACGCETADAARRALLGNRMAGNSAKAQVFTPVREIIEHFSSIIQP